MKRDDSQVALLSHTFFKQPAVSYWTDNLEKVVQELQSLDIMIVEDDSKSQPPRISILDPLQERNNHLPDVDISHFAAKYPLRNDIRTGCSPL
jgi:hypothetical protein